MRYLQRQGVTIFEPTDPGGAVLAAEFDCRSPDLTSELETFEGELATVQRKRGITRFTQRVEQHGHMLVVRVFATALARRPSLEMRPAKPARKLLMRP